MMPSGEIERFLEHLERNLEGAGRYRAGVIAEIESHLVEDMASLADAGEASLEQVIRRFGRPDDIARELNLVHRALERRRRVRVTISLACALWLVAAIGVLRPGPIAPGPSSDATAKRGSVISGKGRALVVVDPQTRAVLLVDRRS